ncbi:ABC transporter permease subunit [Antarcticirhabdus aurantiaca]|uniref:ABC transporter permease subunit n=1 Tax=Antarcticirhabdus aurantiaca TaxID=2606717 RepID=A0ACD4NT23_9HYPH|nr:ABC transporter permease subunit [Antarcticirhabdus aurantiaca]WAJ30021.1 ABC transporter permease subunit [Jeongeuplla avenae]
MSHISAQESEAGVGADIPSRIPAGNPRAQVLREFWYYFSRNKGAVLGLFVFLLVVLVALFAPLIAPHNPLVPAGAIQLPPAWWERGNPSFLLGTDDIGRDILSRLIFGARYSLFIGLVVVTLSVSVGITLGLIAGYVRGWLDIVIMRVMDVILAVPSLLLALALVAILGPSLVNVMIAIALTLQPHFVRLTRAAVLAEKERDYVTAARVVGAGPLRLMVVTILPNCLGPLIVQATLSFSNAILDAAALGFLGMGAQPPTPEWGTMLAGAREFISSAPWIVTYPGLAILITVLAINLVGDGLRDALDPKLKRS